MWDKKSGLLDKLLSALGAGDGDFTLTAGDADGLAALGAGEIAVAPVLNLVKEPQEFPIFLVPGIGIPGKHPEQGPEHQAVIGQGQHQLHGSQGDEGAQQTQDQGGAEGSQAQLVGAVSACHELAEAGGEPVQKLSEHWKSPYNHNFFSLY